MKVKFNKEKRLNLNEQIKLHKRKLKEESDDYKRKKPNKEIDKTPNSEITKVMPSHPRDRLKREVKKQKDKLNFVKVIQSHPRHRLKRTIKKQRRK